MSSTITIREARLADVQAMAEIDRLSFQDSPLRQAMFPLERRIKPGTQDQTDFFSSQMETSVGTPGSGSIVAVDTDPDGPETVVGYGMWLLPKPIGSDKEEDKKKKGEATTVGSSNTGAKPGGTHEGEEGSRKRGIPSCIDMDAANRANEAVSALREVARLDFKVKSDETMWTLNALGVDPKHRRKGIGQKLVQWGIDKATAAGEDIWLIATVSGRYLYESVGFDLVCEGERCGEPQFVMVKMHK